MTLNRIIGITAIAALLPLAVVAIWVLWPKAVPSPVLEEQPLSHYVERHPYVESSLKDEMLSFIDTDEPIEGYLFITSGLKIKPSTGSWAYDLTADSFDYLPLNTTQLHQHLFRSQISQEYIYKGTKTANLGEDWSNPEIRINDETGDRKLPILGEDILVGHYYSISLPRLSPTGEYYAYSLKLWTKSETEPETDEIDSWQINVGQTNSDEPSRALLSGYNAQWTSDGKWLVYVKKDGLFARPFSGDFEVDGQGLDHLLVKDLISYRPNNQFSLSSDDRYLAVTQPVDPAYGNPHVDIYRLIWEGPSGPSAEMVQRVIINDNGGAYWPIFSPGGRYLSMQTRHFLGDGREDNHIRIFDLANSAFVTEIDYNDADFDVAFNTGWVKEFDIADLSD